MLRTRRLRRFTSSETRGEVLPPLFRRNGAVQNAVYIAADGGHRRLQLVADVGDELLALVLALLQRGGHIVKRHGQLVDFHHIVPPGFHRALRFPWPNSLAALAMAFKGGTDFG